MRQPTDRGQPDRTVHVDTHVHTAASHDCESTPAEVLAAARRADLDGVVVTDHDTVEGARVAQHVASPADPVVLRGVEVSTAHGHLLGIGVDDAPEPGRPLVDTARAIRSQGGLAVVPHPFQRARHGVGRDDIAAVDGIEGYNAQTLTGVRNTQARRFAARHGYPAFGASDAHTAASVGKAATQVAVPPDDPLAAETILDGMRAGRTRPVGDRIPALRYVSRVVTTATLKTQSLL